MGVMLEGAFVSHGPSGLVAVKVVRPPNNPAAAVSTLTAPSRVVDAALRAVLSIEEHEIREQLVLDGKRSQPLDPHTLPDPTNTTARSPD